MSRNISLQEAAYQDWRDFFQVLEEKGAGLSWALDLSDGDIYIPVEVDVSLLLQVVPELGKELLQRSIEVLEAGQKAAEDHIKDLAGSMEPLLGRYVLIAPFNLPTKATIASLSAHGLGKLVSFNATVSIRGRPGRKVTVSVDYCKHCGMEWRTKADQGVIPGPLECNKDGGGCGKKAGNAIFKHDPERSEYIDHMKIELEDVHDIDLIGQPEKVIGWIDGDLAGDPSKRPEAGAQILVTGLFLQENPQNLRTGGRKEQGRDYIQVLHIDQEEREDLEVTEEDQARYMGIKDQALDHITRCIAPDIYGYPEMKEGLALYLFGGGAVEGADGKAEDSPISVLVVGDPSTGKTKIIDGACLLAPRSFKASGKSTTGRGLVAAVVPDGLSQHGERVLKAGVLARADKGHARIDELDKLHPEDQDSLREAMSEGKVPINKGGISATIHTRAAVAAAANPIMEVFDGNTSPKQQQPLSPALVSRFHLIYYVAKDENQHAVREILRAMSRSRRSGKGHGMDWPFFTATADKVQDIRKYVTWARQQGPLTWDDQAEDLIVDQATTLIWQYQGDLRSMEGLQRMAEATARARLSRIVTPGDVARALDIFQVSLRSEQRALKALPEERKEDVRKQEYGRVEA